jgi:phenylalanyl-tRNA synthetase beta chain
MSFHPNRQANLSVHGLAVGSFGEVHPSLLEKFAIKQRVYFAEIDLQALMRSPKIASRMTPIPQFPASDRDWTISLPLQTPIQSVFDRIYSVDAPLLEKVELIDLYIPENEAQKNATFRFVYRSKLKTPLFEEVEAEHEKLISQVGNLKPLD